MARRSAFRNLAEETAIRAGMASLRRMPLEEATERAYAWLQKLRRAVPRYQEASERNLDIAFPGLSAGKQTELIDGCWMSIARLLASLARFPDLDRRNIHELIRYEGFEHFEEAKRRGKGVLFATGHLGNWELSAFSHALMSEPMDVVVRPLDNPRLDALAETYRTLSGNRILGRGQFLRPLVQSLRNNDAVGILVDQNTTADRGVFVDFFGTPACVDASFARLAARTGAAVIPGFAVWNAAEHKYVLKFYEPVTVSGDELADTQAVQKALETAVREFPDQWLWIHRRWKTRPPGEPSLY